MLDYASLAAVAQVVRDGSFERAARALHVTPSAISQRIRLLEERMGLALIVRGTPCTATEAGQRLCRHVEQVGMLEHDLHRALPAMGQLGDPAGRLTLKVAVNADSLDSWFVGAAARFCDTEAALVDVSIDDQDHTAEWLRSGAVIAAVTASAKPIQGCRSIPLGRMPYVATASPAFVKRYLKNGIDAASLARTPCMTFSRKDALQADWLRQVCGRSVEVPRHWLPSSQAFVAGALTGLGWGMNPRMFVADLLKRGKLVELVPGTDLSVALHWQHARLQIPMLDRLTEAVVTTARDKLVQED